MQEVCERIDGFTLNREIRAKVCDQLDLDIWLFFVIKNSRLQRNFQFHLDFNRIAKEELN